MQFYQNSNFSSAHLLRALLNKDVGLLKYLLNSNKDVGYLVIFNVCDKDLRFSFTCADKPPRISSSNKTVFVIDIDIYHDILPASERPKLEVYEITEAQLQSVDDIA